MSLVRGGTLPITFMDICWTTGNVYQEFKLEVSLHFIVWFLLQFLSALTI
jgi:hypothetical protein